jgi:hypothetical protein
LGAGVVNGEIAVQRDDDPPRGAGHPDDLVVGQLAEAAALERQDVEPKVLRQEAADFGERLASSRKKAKAPYRARTSVRADSRAA